jgi:hypothetical protein
VSITVDLIFLLGATWVFLAYLYYTHRRHHHAYEKAHKTMKKSNKKSTSRAAAKRSSNAYAANTDAAQQIKKATQSLQRLLVSRLQIIASILASVSWSPGVPQFLIDLLRFITNIFSVNVPGLLTSADCVSTGGENGSGLGPLQKWYLGMFIPFGILLVFGLWYRCLPSKSIAKSTVKEAGVQVCFVWLFVTIVTSSLKIFDCDDVVEETQMVKTLIMDPSMPCPLGGRKGKVGLAILSMLVLFIYILVPYSWFFWNRSSLFCGGCSSSVQQCYNNDCCNTAGMSKSIRAGCLVGLYIAAPAVTIVVLEFAYRFEDPMDVIRIVFFEKSLPILAVCVLLGAILGKMYGRRCSERKAKEDSSKFLTAFKWALQNYKQEIEGFEIWNIISKTLIIVGSTVMYKDNRFATHIMVMSWSLFLHIRFRPFRDRDSNICAILFCSCDILGAMSARYTSAGLQIMFIVCSLATIITTGRCIAVAMRNQSASLRTGLSSQGTSDIFAVYTPLEKKLLFPVLAVVWISIKIFSRCCGSANSDMPKTKVVPTEKNGTTTDSETKTEESTADPVILPTKEWDTWHLDELETLSKHLKNYKKVFKDCGKLVVFSCRFYSRQFFADISVLSFSYSLYISISQCFFLSLSSLRQRRRWHIITK